MWANDAYIGRPVLHHTKFGLTASNLQNLSLHLSNFLELLIDLEAIEAEVMGLFYISGFLGSQMGILSKNEDPIPNGVAPIPKTKKCNFT